MTERPPNGSHLQISKLLMVTIVMAVAATGALIVALIVGNGPRGGPNGGGQMPNGMPPPPPDIASIALVVITGLFVLSWLAVLVVFSRDQILGRIRQQQPATGPGGVSREELTGLLADLRTELAADRERDNEALTARLAADRERDHEALTARLAADRERENQALTARLAVDRERENHALTVQLAADRERENQALTAQLTADRERDNEALSARLAEYGEQRETDGYLSGMRMATANDPSAGNVRSLRRPPPQR